MKSVICLVLDCPLINRPSLMVVFSLVCSVRPVSPFGNVSSSVGEDGALISWEYWGPEKNVYVEYIVENSKQSNTPLFLSFLRMGGKRLLLHYWLVQVNRKIGSHVGVAPANVDPDVINKAVCDWTVNYSVPAASLALM